MFVGREDELELLVPNNIEPIVLKIEKMWDYETDEEIAFVNPGKAEQKVKFKIPTEAKEGYILRRKK